MKNKNLHDQLKSIPLAERPKMLPPPWSKDFFKGAALIRIAFPALLLVCNGIAATIIRKQGGPALATVIALGFLFGTIPRPM